MTRTETTNAGVSSGPLGTDLLEQYGRDGFLLLPPEFLTRDVLNVVESVIPSAVEEDSPRRIMERDGTTVRSVYGLHRSHPAIADLTRLPKLLGAVRQLLGDEVYVHQSKINFKEPFFGDQWEWHQDYIYWLRTDGIENPDLINAAIFVDDVTEFNGPLTFVRGSHQEGVLAGTDVDGMPMGYEDAPSWVATLTANEKFQVGTATIAELADRYGLVSPKGPAGSLLLFNPNLLHSSVPNISPYRRAMLMFVYNTVSNRPRSVANPRPAFLADPDVRPLRPL